MQWKKTLLGTAAMYPRFQSSGAAVLRGLKFAAVIGAFFWTSHVLAFIAKQSPPSVYLFTAMETVYLAIQFGTFGVLIALIHTTVNASRAIDDRCHH